MPECPITKMPLVDPVVAGDGESYERSAWESYAKRQGSDGVVMSPMHNTPLPQGGACVPNRTLKRMIDEARRGGK